MRAIWLEDRTPVLREDLPIPVPAPGEALIRVLQAGICGTDLHLINGYYPYTGVLGHEFVGLVESGGGELEGKRVVGEINVSCGECSACLNQRKTHCEARTVLGIVGRNGAFAEYLTLPVENLHPVPDGVSDDAATFTEPLAAAFEILEQVEVRSSDRVLVVGDGRLGQLAAQAIALTGCDLRVAGRHQRKLSVLEGLGIRTLDSTQIAFGSYDIAVDCTGNPSGFAAARNALRARGTLVLKSTYPGELTLDASSIVVDEIRIVGSRCGPFAPALMSLQQHRVRPEVLIDHRYSLSDGLLAFKTAGTRGTLKVLLDIQ